MSLVDLVGGRLPDFGAQVRLYALKLQDRIIRLEERLRLTQLLSEPLRSPHSGVDGRPTLRPAVLPPTLKFRNWWSGP